MLKVPCWASCVVSSSSKRAAISRDRWLALSNSVMTSASDSSSVTAKVPSSRREYPSHSDSLSPAQKPLKPNAFGSRSVLDQRYRCCERRDESSMGVGCG